MANQQTLVLAEDVIGHMMHMKSGDQHGSMLLTGDPGIGKTTFINTLGALLGMRTIVIEVPHVTEEHLINIPFLLFNPKTGTSTESSTTVKGTSSFDMVLADSHLYTQLENAEKLSDTEYLEYMQHKAPPDVTRMFVALGGGPNKIPQGIKDARSKYSVILFLDEFARATSMRIRNMLRSMLNKNIGKHKIPGKVYQIYATNMRDEGLDPLPHNYQFNMVDFQAPSSKDWFEYLVDRYEHDEHIKLRRDVVDKFKECLEDQDISFDDHSNPDAKIRTSPRRWENLLTYINASIPCKDVRAARALLTNVKNNFVHYKEGNYSALTPKVLKAVIELVQETSGINLSEGDTLAPEEWRDSLNHIIDAQIETGNKRKHIPVLSGPPGIGKTYYAAEIAMQHNLRLIEIDAGELFADDATGMPIPDDEFRDKRKMRVKFSWPKLYDRIINEIKEKDHEYLEGLAKYEDKAEAKKEADTYAHQKFKYLIFFDELNRVDPKTFNALRRVILEKNFGEYDGQKISLPKEAIVVAAINPHGEGTADLTDHFRDVIDPVNAHGSWRRLKTFLMAKKFEGHPEELKEVAYHLMELFAKKFQTSDHKVGPEQRPFYLDLGGVEVYLSQREYTDMFATIIRILDASIKKALQDDNVKEDQLRDFADHAVARAMLQALNFPLHKAEASSEEFKPKLLAWIQSMPASVYGGMLKKKAKGVAALGSSLLKYLDGHDLQSMPDDEGVLTGNNHSNNIQAIDEIKDTLHQRLVDTESIEKYVLDQTHPRIVLSGDNLEVDSSQQVSLLENFFLAVLFTLHMHEYTNDRIASVRSALSKTFSEIERSLVREKKIDAAVAKKIPGTIGKMNIRLLEQTRSL